MGERTILVWFRNDLRIHDNEILLRATERGQRIVPVFCFDPRHFTNTKSGTKKTGVLRAAFLRENVFQLQQTLKRLGGNLVIAFGHPEDLLPKLAEQHGVYEVYHHREVAYEETLISARVEEALWQMQINLRHFIGHTLYHKEDLPFPIKDIPDAFAVFRKKTERESSIRPQLPIPKAIVVPEDLDEGYLPDLAALGFSPAEIQLASTLQLAGGESAALERMKSFLYGQPSEMDLVALSPYIAVGALSPNTLYHAAKDAEATTLGKKRTDQINLKLLWRDYYRFMFKKHGNRFFRHEGITGQPPENVIGGEADFDRWKNGNTGHPVVDRAMRQLNETGRIPHHERLILAAYLVNELHVNWLLGAAWFEEKLLDYSPANNYGNWAHVAGVGSSIKENRPVDFKKLIAQFYPKEVLALD